MRLREVIKKAAQDSDFAKRLKAQARKAALEGVHSPEWEEYMGNFAENQTELARLTPRVRTPGVNFDSRATMFTLGTHGIVTFFTTFTDTVSLGCESPAPLRGGAKKGAAQAKSGASSRKGKTKAK